MVGDTGESDSHWKNQAQGADEWALVEDKYTFTCEPRCSDLLLI